MDTQTQPTTVDAAVELAGFARRFTKMYVCDLKALSQEHYAAPHGGVTRSAHEITAEIDAVNRMIANRIQTGTDAPKRTDEEREAHSISLSKIEDGIAAVQASGEALAVAILDGRDRLGETMMAPWGEESTVYRMTFIFVSHILYHDGQLNYLQIGRAHV